MSQYRELRAFVIFDLPTLTKEDIRLYNQFRKSIMNDGFMMLQFSVYCRFCRNDTEYRKIIRRIKSYAPYKHGNIRLFALTERQYAQMQIISGSVLADEELLSINPLVIIE